MSKLLVFVYGTLKGEGYVEAITTEEFFLFDGHYPVMMRDLPEGLSPSKNPVKAQVCGQLRVVSQEELDGFDSYEGYNPDNSPFENLYNREVIQVTALGSDFPIPAFVYLGDRGAAGRSCLARIPVEVNSEGNLSWDKD